MKKCIIDIETTNLLAQMLNYTSFPYILNNRAKLWCVVVRDYQTGEVFRAKLGECTREWLEKVLLPYDVIIAHNGIKFDFPALQLFGIFEYTIGYPGQKDTVFGREVRIDDSLILSRLANPDRLGGHGLEAWGLRVGDHKTDFREEVIKAGIIERSAPKGAEFLQWTPLMLSYCEQDTKTNATAYTAILKEYQGWDGWSRAIKMEHKLADLAIKRETFGFWFDKDYALLCIEDLTQKMEELTNRVNPNLPQRPFGKGELDNYTPPKSQTKADGSYTQSMIRFADKIGGTLLDSGLMYEGYLYELPITKPLKTSTQATIGDLDAVKMHLIDLGWFPSEWRERDLTKDSKKQNITIEKRVKALDRWYAETMAGKYKAQRIEFLGIKESDLYSNLRRRINDQKPVRVPTSPTVRVGVEKELCPNLISLGEKVDFAKDFADYLTYRHRKSSIAGGDIEDMDFDSETPNTGYLSMYREEDGRVATPAIEIGASTSRYRHIGIANIPRAGSTYGKEMRSLFGCGEGFLQFGYDFASLEARIEGHYVWNYTNGQELAISLLAEKPNDIHSVTGVRLGITRNDAKSINYAVLYGAQVAKLAKMLNISKEEAQVIYDGFWEGVPALKELKIIVEQEWKDSGKRFVRSIDGRKINIRSQHSILNALFQSAGVICAKYVLVYAMQQLEEAGYCIDPFVGKPDVAEMISYHDEAQLAVNPEIIEFEKFDTKEEAEEFVKEWSGFQLSAVSEGNKWYVAYPNMVSLAIQSSIERVEQEMGLNVNLGYEWIVNKTWYGCH